ncbi:hypothetical protein BN2476_2130009 [Paraburkholderia piptadeniae]|uniref:Transposase n=1 Tax=Paraburkholderia piptadeniae TaxID=1701573 RepID=A0A1N7SXS6_9BURK|nr:hypothetical protein BN2476_2130009 [Paraburkholderia piptadeniae]
MIQSVPACARTLRIRSVCVRLEQILAEPGISVDHSTVHRWALKLLLVRARREEVIYGLLNDPPRRLVSSGIRGFST